MAFYGKNKFAKNINLWIQLKQSYNSQQEIESLTCLRESVQNKIINNFQKKMKKFDDPPAARKKLQDYSYLLHQNIGKGYSSCVFKGRNDVTDEKVAIKVIDMKKINNEIHKNLLASEIEVLKILKSSQNVIEVYDIYNTKNNTYIITELCDGGDLAKLISSRKAMPEAEAIPLMNQIISGYNSMHSHGIIHRDLKPANIFLSNDEIKIADFGFAMKQSESKKYSSYNVGSPVYMPPQALNQNKYSFKSDIWALGVIYYELLTGKTPWRAKTQKELARLLQSIPIKKLLPPSISQSSEYFLLKSLTVNINERMSPDDVLKFNLICDKVSMPKQLYSTQNSIFDGRNNNIRRPGGNGDRHQTSLNKKSINQPGNNLKKLAMLQTNDEFRSNKVNLPKTAATSTSNKTEHFLPESNKTINNEPLTQKQINTQQIINNSSSYDKKYLAKQLLSQIHLCRFLYKLLARMNDKLTPQLNSELVVLKENMSGLIFEKLTEVEELRNVNPKIAEDFQNSNDFNKIQQIILQYQSKYSRDLAEFKTINTPLPALRQKLNESIVNLYNIVEGKNDIDNAKQQVIVLDYLVTLRQLIGLLLNNDLEGFHIKSKIETIVEGSPAKNITQEHLNAIRTKLKAIKII